MINRFVGSTHLFRTLQSCVVRKEVTRTLSMYTAAVKLFGDEFMTLNFYYKVNGRDRLFTFNRKPDETLNVLFERMQNNISQKVNRKRKGKQKETEDSSGSCDEKLAISLLHENIAIDKTLSHINAWKPGSILKIGDQEYNVVVNAPIVKSLKISKCIMAGFDVYPTTEVEFCNEEDCRFLWYKKRLPHEKKPRKDSEDDSAVAVDGWFFIGEAWSYKPTTSDIGRLIKLKCVPLKGEFEGVESTVESRNVVEAGPGVCPFDERHAFTKQATTENSFRFVSYNILADLYADSDYSRTVLFPYCPPNYLDIDYRKNLLFKEIVGYNGDVICLQEVDRKLYSKELARIMRINNRDGVFHEKGEDSGEGLALFFNNTKFKMLESSSINISKTVDKYPIFSKLKSQLVENGKFYERFMQRKTILQHTLLRSTEDENKALLVGNTHLYFHPDSDHIRLTQSSVCVAYLEHLLQLYHTKYKGLTISSILCGDFNSCPEFGVYKLMTSGFVGEDCVDWKSNIDEEVKDVRVSHSLSLSSACGTPQYTNYTPVFSGCLDYIFYDNINLSVEEVIPFPSHEQVTQLTAIPNALFPSDHLALVATLKWNR